MFSVEKEETFLQFMKDILENNGDGRSELETY